MRPPAWGLDPDPSILVWRPARTLRGLALAVFRIVGMTSKPVGGNGLQGVRGTTVAVRTTRTLNVTPRRI